jgi:phosphate acetyltransferase
MNASLFQELPRATRERILASARGRRVGLPESSDPRVREAADLLEKDYGVAAMLPDEALLANETSAVLARLREVALARGRDPSRLPVGMECDPFYTCGTLLAQGRLDAVVGGATVPTAHVIRAALSTVGVREGVSLVSSAFLMALSQPTPGGEPLLVYSDGAVNPQPTSAQLADIAWLAADAFTRWTGEPARVAFLSFSTRASAEHADVAKVRTAFELFQTKHPDVVASGEVQFDAAVVPGIARRKDPGSEIEGRANVLVFPDLDAGNIGYKMTERLAGAGAFGPVLLGVARPFSDLSRGATSLDVVAAALLTLALA